jgi:hypothetical protein
MIARLVSLFVALAAILWTPSAAALFRYPSTCGPGCARVSAYRDARGPTGSAGGGVGDWACGGNSYDGHRGTDFAMGRGNAIVAAASGVVTNARDGVFDGCTSGTCSPGEGNFVEIRDGSGRRTRYLHMRAGSVAVGIGASVGCGQKLGEVASSGASTGNHLHFDVRPDGASVASCYDPFAGPCGSGSTSWTSQGGYNGLPGGECSGVDEDGDGSPRGVDCDDRNPLRTPGRAEVCDNIDNDCDGAVDEGLARGCGSDVGECRPGTQTCSAGAWGACVGSIDPVPESCDEKDNDCDGQTDEEQVCEHEEVAIGAPVYSDGANSDLNGDGRADACALTSAGFQCMLSTGTGFDRLIAGPELATEGLSPREIVPSLRMGDVDGDGRADVCTRVGSELVCFQSTGDGFGERLLLAPMGPLAPGAYGPQVLLGDVDGDRADDVCVRDVDGLRCHVGIGKSGRVLSLPALSDAAGFANVIHHGTLRMGDVDGDGRADACARNAEGVVCFLADGNGFGRRIVGPAWSDAAGWNALQYWSTIRLRDIDGDGRADLCARGPDGFRCHLSEGAGFSGARAGPLLADADGWSARAQYATLRIGDVDGDGRGDLCARDKNGVRCWLWSGADFGREIVGPPLSDDAGWAAHYRSIRLGDIDGDGHDDLCARNGEGLRCYTSAGGGLLRRTWLVPGWNDAGLTDPWHRLSLRLGGGAPRGSVAATEEEQRGCGCGVAASGSMRPFAAIALLAIAMRRRRTRAGR